jgi:O-antigen/teichoic acid export membrane protein
MNERQQRPELLPRETISIEGSNDRLNQKIVRGSLWSIGGQIAPLLASLIATPFVIRLLGTESYGVFALINVLIGHLSFADLGMGLASTKFGAEAHAKGNVEEEVAVIWTALLINNVPVIIVATLLIIGAKPLVEQILNIPQYLHSSTIVALYLASFGFIARAIAGVINTPQLIRLRFDLFNLITASCNVLQISLVPIVLLLGGGLVGSVSIMTVMSAIAAITLGFSSQKLLPSLLPPKIQTKLIKPLLIYGITVGFSILLTTIFIHSEKIILAQILSVKSLAYYSVAFTVARLLIFVPLAFNQSLFPAFSRLQNIIDKKPLHRLYTHSSKGLLLSLLPASIVTCCLGNKFLSFWAGEDYGQNSLNCLYILVIGCFFEGMFYIPGSLLRSAGKPHIITWIQITELFPYLWLSAKLTSSFGAEGSALAWSLRAIIECCLSFIFATKLAGFPFNSLLNNRYFYAILTGGFLTLFFSIKFVKSLWKIGIIIIVYLLIYAGLTWKKILTKKEQQFIINLV